MTYIGIIIAVVNIIYCVIGIIEYDYKWAIINGIMALLIAIQLMRTI